MSTITRPVIYDVMRKAWAEAGCTCIPTIVTEEAPDVLERESEVLRVTTTHETRCLLKLAGSDANPHGALAPHIAQAQEEVRARGMCGAIYDDDRGHEVMCLRDPGGHTHPPAAEG